MKKEVGEEEGKGSGQGCSPEGDSTQRRVSVKYSSFLKLCPFRVEISQCQVRGTSVITFGSGVAHLVLVLLLFYPQS